MQTPKVRKLIILLAVSLLVVGLFMQFGLAGSRKEEPEQVIIEKEVIVYGPFSSAARAVEEAKKYSGTTLNVVWEAGLQSQDPLTMGPKWEDLTGIKIKVIELSYNDIYSNQLQDHLTGGSSYDVITFSPLWLIDFVNVGVVEPLNSYMDKYMNKADIDDFLDVYKSEGYAVWGIPGTVCPMTAMYSSCIIGKTCLKILKTWRTLRPNMGTGSPHLRLGNSSMTSATSSPTSLRPIYTAVQFRGWKGRCTHGGWEPSAATVVSSSTPTP